VDDEIGIGHSAAASSAAVAAATSGASFASVVDATAATTATTPSSAAAHVPSADVPAAAAHSQLTLGAVPVPEATVRPTLADPTTLEEALNVIAMLREEEIDLRQMIVDLLKVLQELGIPVPADVSL
jgi:hypothetical protein